MQTDMGSYASLTLCPSHAHHRYQVFDIANGIYYLHSHDVIHGAIKGVCNYSESRFRTIFTPSQLNILVGDSGRACIAGFGHTTVTRNLDSMQDVSHGLGYCTQRVAPEVLFGGKDSKAVDIFAFAMVVIEVRHRQPVMWRALTHKHFDIGTGIHRCNCV